MYTPCTHSAPVQLTLGQALCTGDGTGLHQWYAAPVVCGTGGLGFEPAPGASQQTAALMQYHWVTAAPTVATLGYCGTNSRVTGNPTVLPEPNSTREKQPRYGFLLDCTEPRNQGLPGTTTEHTGAHHVHQHTVHQGGQRLVLIIPENPQFTLHYFNHVGDPNLDNNTRI